MNYFRIWSLIFICGGFGCKNASKRSAVKEVTTLDNQFEVAKVTDKDEKLAIEKIFGAKTYEIPNEAKIGCNKDFCFIAIAREITKKVYGESQKIRQPGKEVTKYTVGRSVAQNNSDREKSESFALELHDRLDSELMREGSNKFLKSGTIAASIPNVKLSLEEASINCLEGDIGLVCEITVNSHLNPHP
jgi:hypothetical protein